MGTHSGPHGMAAAASRSGQSVTLPVSGSTATDNRSMSVSLSTVCSITERDDSVLYVSDAWTVLQPATRGCTERLGFGAK